MISGLAQADRRRGPGPSSSGRGRSRPSRPRPPARWRTPPRPAGPRTRPRPCRRSGPPPGRRSRGGSARRSRSPPTAPISPMLTKFAPRAVRPPSPKSRHWTIRTARDHHRAGPGAEHHRRQDPAQQVPRDRQRPDREVDHLRGEDERRHRPHQHRRPLAQPALQLAEPDDSPAAASHPSPPPPRGSSTASGMCIDVLAWLTRTRKTGHAPGPSSHRTRACVRSSKTSYREFSSDAGAGPIGHFFAGSWRPAGSIAAVAGRGRRRRAGGRGLPILGRVLSWSASRSASTVRASS